MRGSRIFLSGEGRGEGPAHLTEKNSDNVFLGISFLQFYRGGPMVYFKENIFLRFHRASNIFQRRGSNFSRGCGVQMLISIETYRICDFPGVS